MDVNFFIRISSEFNKKMRCKCTFISNNLNISNLSFSIKSDIYTFYYIFNIIFKKVFIEIDT